MRSRRRATVGGKKIRVEGRRNGRDGRRKIEFGFYSSTVTPGKFPSAVFDRVGEGFLFHFTLFFSKF